MVVGASEDPRFSFRGGTFFLDSLLPSYQTKVLYGDFPQLDATFSDSASAATFTMSVATFSGSTEIFSGSVATLPGSTATFSGSNGSFYVSTATYSGLPANFLG